MSKAYLNALTEEGHLRDIDYWVRRLLEEITIEFDLGVELDRKELLQILYKLDEISDKVKH